jgi:glucan phosphoethanolaminetransferase (alkaline phosphatase superfamily)
MHSRIDHIVGVLVVMMGLPVLVEAEQKLPDMTRPPNIVLIAIDTLRADHVGCYGYSRV